MGSIVQKFVAIEIDNALSRHGLHGNSLVRHDLESRAEVTGARRSGTRRVRLQSHTGRPHLTAKGRPAVLARFPQAA